MKKNVAILIRVYDRIEDLKYNLQIIRETWKGFNYHIIVVSNGASNGYIVDEASKVLIDDFILLMNNAGHKRGNSQLLLEGVKRIPDNCEYTIILEADTWSYTDRIVGKYIAEMDENTDVMWASADWYDKDYALATDFAIIRSSYIRNNPMLFDFELYPESHIANYLRDTDAKFIWIKENMPVHVPAYIPAYPYINDSSQKRFYVFPKSSMVTHHIEFVKGGMTQKKRYFNVVSGIDFFSEEKVKAKGWKKFKMNFWIGLSKLFVKKSWFKKKYYRVISE